KVVPFPDRSLVSNETRPITRLSLMKVRPITPANSWGLSWAAALAGSNARAIATNILQREGATSPPANCANGSSLARPAGNESQRGDVRFDAAPAGSRRGQ